ncbi:unnamed protein product [Caretta caretta]
MAPEQASRPKAQMGHVGRHGECAGYRVCWSLKAGDKPDTALFQPRTKGDQTAGERCTRDSTGVSSLLLSQKTAHPAIQPFNRCPACVFVVPEAPVVSKLTVRLAVPWYGMMSGNFMLLLLARLDLGCGFPSMKAA